MLLMVLQQNTCGLFHNQKYIIQPGMYWSRAWVYESVILINQSLPLRIKCLTVDANFYNKVPITQHYLTFNLSFQNFGQSRCDTQDNLVNSGCPVSNISNPGSKFSNEEVQYNPFNAQLISLLRQFLSDFISQL